MNYYPFLILRKTKIENDPLSLISFSDSHSSYVYDDFEYEPDEEDNSLVDGYEVNVFEYVPISVTKSIEYIPQFKVRKEFLPKSLIGNASEGDIGVMKEDIKSGSVTCKFTISDNLFREHYQSIYLHYKNLLEMNQRFRINNDNVNRLISLLVSSNRNKQIETIEK